MSSCVGNLRPHLLEELDNIHRLLWLGARKCSFPNGSLILRVEDLDIVLIILNTPPSSLMIYSGWD